MHRRKALEKGILKIMSKMGISVLNSYQGAQTFEAIGTGNEVVYFALSGATPKIGGVCRIEIAEESIIRHKAAFETVVPNGKTINLGDPGYNRHRKVGERHVYTTEVIKNFHTYVKSGPGFPRIRRKIRLYGNPRRRKATSRPTAARAQLRPRQ